MDKSIDNIIKRLNDLNVDNDDLCVKYLEETILPYLRLHCNLDAEHLEHDDGDNFAWIRLDAPKDYEDIKGYIEIGIGVSVDQVDNPNNEPLNNPLTIISYIFSNDDEVMDFPWYSLEEMVKGINELK